MRRQCQYLSESAYPLSPNARSMFQGLRSLLPSMPGCRSLNCPPSGSECHCMTGTKQASCVARMYSSGVGSSPANPPISKPQKTTPLADALRPALRTLRSSSKLESWSPAQSMGVVCAPT